jgi:hypothetical protein
VFTRYCCLEDVGFFDIGVSSEPAAVVGNRDLVVEDVVSRRVGETEFLYGDALNTGRSFLSVEDAQVYVGFWSGDELVDLRAAFLPVYRTGAPGGQPIPPGFRMPWSVRVDAPYDRVEAWTVVTPFPPGMFPIPLGIRELEVRPAIEGAALAARVYNCGAEPAADLLFIAVERDADGRVVQFERGAFAPPTPLRPGDDEAIVLEWDSARPLEDPARVALHAFTLQSQALRPAHVPCRDPADRTWRLWLPVVLDDAGLAPGGVVRP